MPAAEGVNFSLSVQDCPGFKTRLGEHVPIPPPGKSPAFAPVIEPLMIVNGTFPVLVKVPTKIALVEPTGTVPKLMALLADRVETVVVPPVVFQAPIEGGLVRVLRPKSPVGVHGFSPGDTGQVVVPFWIAVLLLPSV